MYKIYAEFYMNYVGCKEFLFRLKQFGSFSVLYELCGM